MRRGNFYAIDDVCTHDGGPLGEGELDGLCDRLPAARREVRLSRRPGLTMPATQPTVVHECRSGSKSGKIE